MDWSGVDYCDVLSDSHSDGTHSLQSIHCWDTDAMLHFSKSDEETNSSWMSQFQESTIIALNQGYLFSLKQVPIRTKMGINEINT